MARHEDPFRAHQPKRSAGERRAVAPQAPTQEERSPGAAAQLAAVHRTLRQGPDFQLNPAGAAAGARPAATERAAAPNRTGLPDRLKSGVEALSGVALDDVKVHYNSAKPAALQAHAFTQGADIHVAPGQEQHLPHEAWHVVQQKQGRVKPTLQMKGVAINDDAGLEREADMRGAQALAAGAAPAALVDAPLLQQVGAGDVAQAVKNHKSKKIAPKFSDDFKTSHIAADAKAAQTIFDGRNVKQNTTATEAAWTDAINGNDTEFKQGHYAHYQKIYVDVDCIVTRKTGQSAQKVRTRRLRVTPDMNTATADHIY